MSNKSERKLRNVHLALAAVAVVALAVAAPPAQAAEQCISSGAKKRLAFCPTGKFKASLSKRPEVSFSSAPEELKLKKRGDMTKPVNPTKMAKAAQRDERRVRMKARARKLLTTEIQNVERLYRSTPRKSRDRPRLMRRLAEGYVELESASFREKVEAEVKYHALKKKSRKKAMAWLKRAKRASAVLKLARKQAIRYYARLKKQYPKWCQFPKQKEGHRGCTDEVLYYLAYEYEQAGKLDKARDVYLELIDNWKKSRFIPNAFLAFGELFFNEAQGDPSKWGLAEQAYKNVIKYPPPDNKLFGYARYKLGYVYWNKGEFDKAIDEFKNVIEFGTKYSSLPNAKGLADSARKDIIPVYAIKGDPAKAYGFFRPLSGDKGSSSKKTFAMMEKLGTTLLDTGHYAEAIVLYEDLIKRNPGDNWCEYRANITKATMAMKSGDKDIIVAALQKQLDDWKRFAKEKHSNKAQLQCANDTAGLMTETAMAWHLEAVGSGGVRGTGDPKTMKAAEDLYELVVSHFTAADFKKFRFPRIVKEDWPTIPKIRYAMADLLYFQKKWDKCGPAFDAVVAEDPNGPNAAEAAFASVLCYQNIYAQKHKDGSHRKGSGNLPQRGTGKEKSDAEKYKPKELTPEQKGMLTAFNRYICYIKPPKGNRDAEEQYVEVKYARARTYFEAQHWEEAAEAFRDVGMNHSDMDAGIYAAQLYLESINVLGSKIENPRISCFDQMEADVPKFLELYCTGKKLEENEEQCDVLSRIQRDIEALHAEEMVKQCDEQADQGKVVIKCYEKAADLYLKLWKKYGETACAAEKEGCQKMDKILYNAARAFQAARLIAKAIAVRKILINPDYHLNDTEAAKRAVYEIGGNYQAIAVYDMAAHWYEQFADQDNGKDLKCSENEDTCPDKAQALSDAVVLRLGLGQESQAIDDANKFRRRYGARKPAEAAQIAFAVGAHYADREDWKQAERQLSRAMRQIQAKANLDVKIQAMALLARAYDEQGRTAQADRYYRQVLGEWKNPSAQRKKLDALGGSDGQKVRRLGKVLTSVGEALYHFAEKERAKAERLDFPEYKGAGERKDVQKHIETKVKKWMEQKEPAIREAEKEYLKIVKLEPTPPPKWVIKAGAAVGNMWGRYVAEFRSAPYPKEWDQKGESPIGGDPAKGLPPLLWSEIRAAYLAGLDQASEKQRRMAKAAYMTCLDYSVKYQYFDEDSRSCEEWLSKNYPNEFHLIDEFRGSPTRVNSGLDERALALSMDGQPVMMDTREAAAKRQENEK